MKFSTILFIFLFFSLYVSANDTIPNPGMESWINHGTYFDPTGWTTLNSLTSGVGATTCTQSTGDKHSGTYAVKLTTKSIGNIFVPAILTTGQIDVQSQNVVGGIPISSRPVSLDGWFKYTPSGVDTASLEIHLYNAQTEIGTGVLRSSGTGGAWSAFSVPVTYTNGTTPDTIRVLFSSSATDTPRINSVLLLDDISYSYVSGITENEIQQVNLFPNPANDVIMIDNRNMHVETIQLYSSDGRLAKRFWLIEDVNQLNIADLPAGIYWLNAKDKNGVNYRSRLIVE